MNAGLLKGKVSVREYLPAATCTNVVCLLWCESRCQDTAADGPSDPSLKACYQVECQPYAGALLVLAATAVCPDMETPRLPQAPRRFFPRSTSAVVACVSHGARDTGRLITRMETKLTLFSPPMLDLISPRHRPARFRPSVCLQTDLVSSFANCAAKLMAIKNAKPYSAGKPAPG